MIRSTSSLKLLHGSSGVVPASEQRLVNTILTALRKEKMLDREGGIFDDDCIVHPKEGDEDMFNDLSDFVAYLKGYVILSVEEYSRLGGGQIR